MKLDFIRTIYIKQAAFELGMSFDQYCSIACLYNADGSYRKELIDAENYLSKEQVIEVTRIWADEAKKRNEDEMHEPATDLVKLFGYK